MLLRGQFSSAPYSCSVGLRASEALARLDDRSDGNRPSGAWIQDLGELNARADAQLPEGVAEVQLDSLAGDEQRLGDLPVAQSGGSVLGDTTLGGGERVQPGHPGAARSTAGDDKFRGGGLRDQPGVDPFGGLTSG
jgi:hypothetical protein